MSMTIGGRDGDGTLKGSPQKSATLETPAKATKRMEKDVQSLMSLKHIAHFQLQCAKEEGDGNHVTATT